MGRNAKQTSRNVASRAAATLADKGASKIVKSLAASALAQSGSGKQTSAEMENKASKALSSDKYSDLTKEFAASVLSQANRGR
jgi:hypothetical protein